MQKNIFCTKESEKLEKKIKISNVFPIYIKNPSNLELEYLKRENYKKNFSIISIFPNLTYLFETEECLNDPKYYAFKRQIYDIRSLYRKNKNTKIEEYVKNNDIKAFCDYFIHLKENMIVIEVKDWKKLDSYIMKYYNCNYFDVEDLGYRKHFLKQYLNLFNIVNLDMTKFQGITLINSDDILMHSFYTNNDYKKNFLEMILNPYIIDSFVKDDSQIMDLFFIINNFEKVRYLKERKAIIDLVTCLEFFLVQKLNASNSKLENQFKFKIRKCCNEMGYKVSINELQDLYDYRSLIVHGNFKKVNDKTEKITNRQWYFEYVKNSEFNGTAHYYDNSDKEDLIFCRLFEIFNVVFRLYCKKNEAMKILKELADKELIEMFCFGGDS